MGESVSQQLPRRPVGGCDAGLRPSACRVLRRRAGHFLRFPLQLRLACAADPLRGAVRDAAVRDAGRIGRPGADAGARRWDRLAVLKHRAGSGGSADFGGRGMSSPGSPLATTLRGISLRNPVIAASGTFGYGVEFEKLVDMNSLGGLVAKGLSREPMDGNPEPRLWETRAGMINSVGLQNIGVRAFVQEKLPALAQVQTAVFANVFGYATEDYVEVVRVLEDAPGVAGYELNVSCPNTRHGGIYFSNDPALLGEVTGAVKRVAKRPLIVKLSPNVAHIAPLAQAAAEAGADAISLVNTFIALAVDARARRPRIGAGFGGLSGPALKPLAVRMVYQAAKAAKIPVLRM